MLSKVMIVMGLWCCGALCAADGTGPNPLSQKNRELAAEIRAMLQKEYAEQEAYNRVLVTDARNTLEAAQEVRATNSMLRATNSMFIEQNNKLAQQNEKLVYIQDEIITKYQESTALNAAMCQKLENMLRFRKAVFKTLDFCILAGTVYCGYWY